jgi:signal transduction histidine kinase/FixJ family two-component response regulator
MRLPSLNGALTNLEWNFCRDRSVIWGSTKIIHWSSGAIWRQGVAMSDGAARAEAYLPSAAASERPILGNSDLARRIRAYDWSRTSLGPPEKWPKSLRTAVGIMLTSRQPIWIGWGRELIYLYNDPYKSIIGGKHPWALGKPVSLVWREIWQDIEPMLSQAMGGDEGTYVESQLLIMERNGYPEETYYTFSYSPIPDDDGGVGGIFCANTDDTQRVIDARQLTLLRELAATTAEARTWQQACERSARALATNNRDLPFAMIYLLEPDGRSATLASTANVDPEHPAVMTTLPLDGSNPWPLAAVAQDHRHRVVSGLEMEFQAMFPSGAWHQAPDTAVVLPIMASGETGRSGFLIAGLNPFRLFDDNYSGFMKLVAGQIAAAISNAEAYEQEWRRAEALAEIDRAKTAFFSNVSHEFRTPLTLMLGPLEEVLRHPEQLKGKRLEEVAVAHRNALRLLRLVNTLLDFSRVEAGRMQPYFEKTDLPALTRDLASSFDSLCERAGLKLTVECEALPQSVYVDRDMWEKIVLNLLSNAFKFTFDGGINIRLRDIAGRVELSVSDTGVGIPASELPHVFERFHRVEGQRGRTHEGSGIGLALVRELVNLLGGQVRAVSEVDRGTTLAVTLPYGQAPAAATVAFPSRDVNSATGAPAFVQEALRWLPRTDTIKMDPTGVSHSQASNEPAAEKSVGKPRLRVLIADDNADMRDYVERMLAAQYDVESVGTGMDALRVIRQRRPDLLLSDVMMPVRDGFALLREIRSDPELKSLPVILLSARAGEEAKIEGLEAGADDYLIKPFGAQELLARVNTNITLARLRHEISSELEAQKVRLQAVLDTVPVAVWFTFDSAGQHVIGNRRAAEMVRLPETANASLSVPPARAPQHYRVFKEGVELPPERLPLRRALMGETITNEEMELHFTDGSVLSGLVQAAPLRDQSGKVVGAVSAGLDITERKRTEEHRLLLLNELNHRVKNTLATVQSIAVQSFRRARTDIGGREMFQSRLLALSRAHDVLTNESWEGANLSEITAQAIIPYRDADPTRFAVSGPHVWLSAKMALSISMALHELATNAVKYGALSNEKGRVSITWQTLQEPDGRRLRLEWSEKDGPPVVPPRRKGFGSRLIERGLAQELGGEVKIGYDPQGVWCEINARLDA